MSGINLQSDSVRVYDFSVLKKSFPIQKNGLTDFKLEEFEEIIKVKNQGCYWACAAFATSVILEYMNYTETGAYTELSPGYIYGKHRKSNSNSSGMSYITLCESLLNYGSVPMSVFSRIAEMPEMKKIIQKRPDLDPIAFPTRIKGFAEIRTADEGQRLEDIKLALLNTKAPLLCIINANTSESHAICVYGFEGDKFLYQNSYGESFGKNGRASISAEALDHIVCFLDEVVTLPFDDVPEDAWFYKRILHLYAAGLVDGRENNKFCPNDYITRAETCTIIDRLMKRIDEVDTARAVSIEERLKRIEEELCLW